MLGVAIREFMVTFGSLPSGGAGNPYPRIYFQEPGETKNVYATKNVSHSW